MRWSIDIEENGEREERKGREAFTRQSGEERGMGHLTSVEHDLHQGGEISFALYMHVWPLSDL